MSGKFIHEKQGSLFDPPEEPIVVTTELEEPEVLTPGVQVELAKRAFYLHRTLGHLAYLSKTANYENIEPWFRSVLYRQHPHDYQQHVDERLEIRASRAAEALVDFGLAFGAQEMANGGLMPANKAKQMAKDFYEGNNDSELNSGSGSGDDKESFKLSYGDSGNNSRLNALRKVLEEQNPELKKKK